MARAILQTAAIGSSYAMIPDEYSHGTDWPIPMDRCGTTLWSSELAITYICLLADDHADECGFHRVWRAPYAL